MTGVLRLQAVLLALCCYAVPVAGQSICSVDWSLEETLRIGSLEGEDALEYVMDLAVAPDHQEIYVPQTQRGEVLVFSESGALLRRIGREGSGPGDFEAGPRAVTWVDDALWVADRFRTQSFGRDGQPTDFVSFRIPVLHEGSFFLPEAPLADGSFWGRRTVTPVRGRPGSPDRLTLRRYDRDGSPLDTIAVLDVRSVRIVTSPETGGFTRHPFWSTLPGGGGLGDIVTGDRSGVVLVDGISGSGSPGSFSLLELSITGDTVLHRTIPYDPIPITDEEREWWFKEFAAVMAGDYTQGRPRYLQLDEAARNRKRREAAELLWLPDHYPPVRRVLAGMDGTIWLLREFRLFEQIDRWEVYDRGGELIGQLDVDAGRHYTTPWISSHRILQASLDEVWATSTDDLEVPYIHRYQVDRGCSSN